MKTKNRKLMALTTAALALPGMIPKSSHAQSTAPDSLALGYRFTEYQEQDQDAASNTTGSAVERYNISVHQFSLVSPITSNVGVSVDAASETMTGASPWYVAEGDDGQPIQVMSGATIDESRNDISVATSYYGKSAQFGLGVSQSTENDYDSTSVNFSTSFAFNTKNTTLDFGFGYSDDTITPTQAPTVDPSRIAEGEKTGASVSIGMSQIMSKTLLIGGGVGIALYEGYLSDPYKLALVEGVALRDSRPDEKQQLSVEFKLRKYFIGAAMALHADYRLYDNDWGVISHTIDTALYKRVSSWVFSGRLRLYDQSSANFYRNFYTQQRADAFYSSDYRLSAYGAASLRMGINKEFEHWALKLSYENYVSGKGSDTTADLNPGLVDFQFLTLGFNYKL